MGWARFRSGVGLERLDNVSNPIIKNLKLLLFLASPARRIQQIWGQAIQMRKHRKSLFMYHLLLNVFHLNTYFTVLYPINPAKLSGTYRRNERSGRPRRHHSSVRSHAKVCAQCVLFQLGEDHAWSSHAESALLSHSRECHFFMRSGRWRISQPRDT